MKIRLNNPSVADELRAALEAADCIAARSSHDTLDVDVPWNDDGDDPSQARLELAFFVRAWEAQYPGLSAVVVDF